jgi:transcription initiation factor TFIIIB Brf1 subunit/transcription initiation factor TFIIB
MSSIPPSEAVEEMCVLAKRLGITDQTRNEAKSILSRALENKKLKKSNVGELARASLYLACRLNNEPVALGSLGAMDPEGKKKVFRTYQRLKRELEVSLAPVDVCGILYKFCRILGIPDDVRMKAESILERSGNDGRSPQTKAQAAILLASSMCGCIISPQKLHEVTGSNITVVRCAAKSMADELKMDPYEEFSRSLCESLSLGLEEITAGLLKDVRLIYPGVLKRPVNTLAGGIVYYAARISGMPLSMSRIAEAAGANESSVRKAYCDVRRVLEPEGEESAGTKV